MITKPPPLSGYKHALFICFFCIAFVVLLAWVNSIDGSYDNENSLMYGGLMFIITFPFGLLANLSVALLFYIFGFFAEHTVVNAMIEWAMYFIAGYVQWFVVLPWLMIQYNKRRKAT